MSGQHLGRLVRLIRGLKGLSYADLATDKLGSNFWRLVETGKHLPTPVEALEMVKKLEETSGSIEEDFFRNNALLRREGSENHMGSAALPGR